MSSQTNKGVPVKAGDVLLPLLLALAVAFIYVLPPLYARYKFDAPAGKVYSQYALGQLYNYDEYGMYLPGAEAIARRHAPYAESFTYEGRKGTAIVPYFAPLYVIAFFKAVTGSGEMALAAVDAVFAVIGFFCIYFLFVKIVHSKKGACIAALLTMLPLPAIRIFELAGIFPSNELAGALLYTGELPMMSRTYSPQMTVPLIALFLIGCTAMRHKRPSRAVIVSTGIVLGLGFYFSIFCGAILLVIGLKVFALDIYYHRRRLRAYVLCGATAMVTLVPCVYFYHHFNTRLAAGDMDKYLLSEEFARFSVQSIAAAIFFAVAYAVYFFDVLKRPAVAASLASMPFAVYFAMRGGVIGDNFYYFTPGIYLLLAAALPRKGSTGLIFLAMSSCIEPAFVLRLITGKTHADVHYFYRSFFLQLVPLMIVSAAWLAARGRVSVPKQAGYAAFGAAVAFVILCGANTAVRFARDNRDNYFISKDMVDGAEWVSRHSERDSVLMSLDVETNIYLNLTTGRYLYLPRAGMSPFSMTDQQSRLADGLRLLSAPAGKLDWHAWKSFGYYMFELYSTRPRCVKEVETMTRLSTMPESSPFRLDYVWFGPVERKLTRVSPSSSPWLKKVYGNGSVEIFRYLGKQDLPAL